MRLLMRTRAASWPERCVSMLLVVGADLRVRPLQDKVLAGTGARSHACPLPEYGDTILISETRPSRYVRVTREAKSKAQPDTKPRGEMCMVPPHFLRHL